MITLSKMAMDTMHYQMTKTNQQFVNVHHGVGDGAYVSELKNEDSLGLGEYGHEGFIICFRIS